MAGYPYAQIHGDGQWLHRFVPHQIGYFGHPRRAADRRGVQTQRKGHFALSLKCRAGGSRASKENVD